MAAKIVAQPDEFIDDPLEGNINPGTKTGSQLYLKATESIPGEEIHKYFFRSKIL